MLNLFHNFMQEMSWQSGDSPAGVQVGPRGQATPVQPLSRLAADAVLREVVSGVAAGRKAAKNSSVARSWLQQLPAAVRQQLLSRVYSCRHPAAVDISATAVDISAAVGPCSVREWYLATVRRAWSLLYSSEMVAIEVPDMARITRGRHDERGSRVEEVGRVLGRVGIISGEVRAHHYHQHRRSEKA